MVSCASLLRDIAKFGIERENFDGMKTGRVQYRLNLMEIPFFLITLNYCLKRRGKNALPLVHNFFFFLLKLRKS